MAPVDSRDYVLSGIYYSVLVRNTCQHSQQTRRWPSTKPALIQRKKHTKHLYNICTMLQADTDPISVKCLASVARAGQ